MIYYFFYFCAFSLISQVLVDDYGVYSYKIPGDTHAECRIVGKKETDEEEAIFIDHPRVKKYFFKPLSRIIAPFSNKRGSIIKECNKNPHEDVEKYIFTPHRSLSAQDFIDIAVKFGVITNKARRGQIYIGAYYNARRMQVCNIENFNKCKAVHLHKNVDILNLPCDRCDLSDNALNAIFIEFDPKTFKNATYKMTNFRYRKMFFCVYDEEDEEDEEIEDLDEIENEDEIDQQKGNVIEHSRPQPFNFLKADLKVQKKHDKTQDRITIGDEYKRKKTIYKEKPDISVESQKENTHESKEILLKFADNVKLKGQNLHSEQGQLQNPESNIVEISMQRIS